MRTLKGNDAGFTLIELMIVVAIIAVIMAISVPNVPNRRHQRNSGAPRRVTGRDGSDHP